MAQKILRPLEYGDLFDEMFDLLKSNFVLFFGIAAIIEVPLYFLIYMFSAGVQVVLYMLAAPVWLIVMTASTWAISRTYLGKDATILGSYKAVVGRIIPFVFTCIIAYVIVALGFVLLIIPGIIFALWFSIVPAVFVVESKSSTTALQRCRQLTSGNLLRIFVVLLLCGIINMIITFILTLPIAFIAGQSGPLYGLFSGIASALTTPITVIPVVLLYYDLRGRKEGFDLELLAADLGETITQPQVPQEEAKPV